MIAKKLNAVFGYIKQPLDANEKAIWELGEQFSH
jgi:hypothetical protein